MKQIALRDESEFVGSSWLELVEGDDRDLLDALAAGLEPGGRRGPISVRLRPREGRRLSRNAALSVFRLPDNGSDLSCALTLGGPSAAAAPEALLDRDAFSAQVERMLDEAERGGAPVRLDLVQLEGLGRATAAMPADEADALRRKVAATLRAESAGGLGASEMAPDRFALVRNPGAVGDLSERLSAMSAGAFTPSVAQVDVESRSQGLRAMRFALDRFIEQGPSAAAATFTAAVEQTVRDANRFKQALASGDFELAYQPIVQLRGDGGLHHFEALARFDRDASPADSIQLAEELGLIVEFDLEVVRMVAKALTAAPLEVRIAANLSAASLLADGFVDGVLAITASKPRLRGRLLLEITETQALKDLAAANAAIGRLRGAGHLICLDDYGAGAASLSYLRSLDVDFVKIDGRYVQRLVAGSRDATIVKHLAALCRELGVTTIAEMIETPEVEAVVRDLGVDLGQGWQFAKPLAQPIWPPASPAVAARRQGVVEGWG